MVFLCDRNRGDEIESGTLREMTQNLMKRLQTKLEQNLKKKVKAKLPLYYAV